MAFYIRHIPHWSEPGQPVFVTWRLYGSLPPNRRFLRESQTSGQAFAAFDRLLETTRFGPQYLAQAEIAEMVIESLFYTAQKRSRMALHAFVVMPNHVHLLITPAIQLPGLMNSMKAYTGRRANLIPRRTGQPFWSEESCDHLLRRPGEFERIRNYIEANPVRAGLASEASQFPFSSAGWAAWRPGCPQGPGL